MRPIYKKIQCLNEDEIDFDFNSSRRNLEKKEDQNAFIDYILFLMGTQMRFWLLHWEAKPNSRHVRLDEFMEEFDEYIDSISENIQGNTQQYVATYKYNTIMMPSCQNEHDLIKMLEDKVIEFDQSIKDDPKWTGACNINGNFLEQISKFKYLFNLCDQFD